MTNNKQFDVIIIGGSYAGLSAAMALGRSLRRVLLIDSGQPCNRQTPHSHNFITQDGEKPAVIAAKAKEQVLKYDTVSWLDGVATAGKTTAAGFEITTAEKETFSGKKLVFATGIRDVMPDIVGFADCWGISVIHCPYCHGYEVRGQKTAIMARGERAMHLASLVRNLTANLTILTNGLADFTPEQQARLKKNNVSIIEQGITEVEHTGGYLNNVVFKDGSRADFKAMYAAIPFVQHSDIPASLGCKLTETGHLEVDTFQKTNVPGIFACGDNAAMMRSVASSVACGNIAGAMANHDLVQANF